MEAEWNQHKYFEQFYNDIYGKSGGVIRLTSAGDRKGIIIGTAGFLKNVYKTLYIDDKNIGRDNRRISLNTFINWNSTSEKNLNDITALAVKTQLPVLGEFGHLDEFWAKHQNTLSKYRQEKLIPTYILCSDHVYYIYLLEKNVHVGHCNGKKKSQMIKFIKHIQKNLCRELNKYCERKFTPVPLTASVNLPNSSYAVFARKKDLFTNKYYSVVTFRGTTDFLCPNGSKSWKSLDELADICMQRYNAYRRKRKKKIKFHIKERAFYGIKDMLRRRMQLIRSVFYHKTYHEGMLNGIDAVRFRDTATFLYFNMAFELEKDLQKAWEKTANDLEFYILRYNTWDRIYEIMKKLTIRQDYVLEGHGYKYTDMKLFECLNITREEAACKYGYVTSDKKEYNKAYAKVRRAAVRKKKEEKGETRWQKADALRKKIASLRIKGYTFKMIAELLHISDSTVAYHFKYHKQVMEQYMNIGTAACSPT